MTLTIPQPLLEHVTTDALVKRAEQAKDWRSKEVDLRDAEITDDALADLLAASATAGDKSFGRVVASIQAARKGDFSKSIPKLPAAVGIFTAFLRHDMQDGWVYRMGSDGHLSPYLVTSVKIGHNQAGEDYLQISLLANGVGERREGKLGPTRLAVTLTPDQVSRKKVQDIFLANGLYKETPELKAEYLARIEEYRVILTQGFAEQYRYTGIPQATDSWRSEGLREDRKVIHDIAPNEIPGFSDYAPSTLFSEEDDETDGTGPVPTHSTLRVFDLSVHDFIWVNTADLVRYTYDSTLREKIILPLDQRNLLDILTTDIETFTADVIEGKSAGNVILCKGIPGVGKTLTAEVYSELIERPLYSIHSGNLGITADSIRKSLEETFKRAKRWNAVLLLDEADVFVIERGNDIQQNAIVAEFLRTLEYFSGLLFMTTNRADHIDDAILSRAAAIIDYKVPDEAGVRAVWQVQARNNGAELPESLLDDLVRGFEGITPRDIKMLLRLALRVAKHDGTDLTIEIFARCAMFRGHHYQA